ncbi:MBL fold metallo-hydrolase [Martelella lutilitoris]|uniref:MBL fold metallo-hydrolase n=1 Tax=Martelella lutilitoris TaxID=2583532 RepID=A0A5C4JQ69_9HYPH|nr:MBL fold metallo-hydrolase [Martelella lutilitoris]TNB47361.1 MBL fold metallo-hydrolase [Martelella lutilitoris]
MARLTVISGLNRKSAAIFLVEANEQRVLLDFGDGLEAGEHPDISRVGTVDAVLLSHAHTDHAGSLLRLSEIGSPPVFATEKTLDFVPGGILGRSAHAIPETGSFDVAGLRFSTGRCGHAPGGVWFHMETKKGGFVYTGDISLESRGMPFDPPPPASTLLIDASYGDRKQDLDDQISVMADCARGGAVLCCPAAGRGTDMALAMASHGHAVHVSELIGREVEAATGRKFPVVNSQSAEPHQVIVATESNAEAGLSAELLRRGGFRFIFSSHVPNGTPAADLIEREEAIWLPWNVHPRKGDVLALADHCGARQVLPAFVDMTTAPELARALGPRLRLERETEI